MNRNRWWLVAAANLLLGAVAMVMVLLLGEFALRRGWLGPVRTNAPSPTRGWTILPNLDFTWQYRGDDGKPVRIRIRTDANGFRMVHEMRSKQAGLIRIGVLGDSFTLGAPIPDEQVYPFVLERALASRAARPVEVVNMGVSAYGVHQEKAALEEQGLALHPDVVVVALYLGNDLQETLGLHHKEYHPNTGQLVAVYDHQIVDGRMVSVPPAQASAGGSPLFRLKRWLGGHSGLYAALVPRIKRSALMRKVGTTGGLMAQVPARLSPEARTLLVWGGDGMASLLRKVPPAMEDAWEILLRHLDAMNADCRAHGARFVVVLIPYRIQLVPEEREKLNKLVGLRDADFDLELPNHRIRAWGEAAGVPVIDLLDDFRRVPDPGSLYFAGDIHWNAKGHVLAGRALARALVDRGIVPARESGGRGEPAAFSGSDWRGAGARLE